MSELTTYAMHESTLKRLLENSDDAYEILRDTLATIQKENAVTYIWEETPGNPHPFTTALRSTGYAIERHKLDNPN